MATAADYMARDVVVLAPETGVYAALQLLLAHDISGAPVVDARGEVLGMFTGRDILGALVEASYHRDPSQLVSDSMSREVRSVDERTDMLELIELFLSSPYRRFPVMSGTRMVGLISRRDVMRAIGELW